MNRNVGSAAPDRKDALDEALPAAQLLITDLETLKLISDPLRLRLVDRLREVSATVKELASTLGVPVRSLYYHISLLERHGLVRVVRTRFVSGILEKRYRATAYLFLFQDMEPGNDQGMQAMVTSLFRITDQEIAEALRAGRLSLDPAASPTAHLMWTWQLLTLTPERATTLARRFAALVEELAAEVGEVEHADATPVVGDGEARPYRMLWTLFPVVRSTPATAQNGTPAAVPGRT